MVTRLIGLDWKNSADVISEEHDVGPVLTAWSPQIQRNRGTCEAG